MIHSALISFFSIPLNLFSPRSLVASMSPVYICHSYPVTTLQHLMLLTTLSFWKFSLSLASSTVAHLAFLLSVITLLLFQFPVRCFSIFHCLSTLYTLQTFSRKLQPLEWHQWPYELITYMSVFLAPSDFIWHFHLAVTKMPQCKNVQNNSPFLIFAFGTTC